MIVRQGLILNPVDHVILSSPSQMFDELTG
jgi:hypothetical protein